MSQGLKTVLRRNLIAALGRGDHGEAARILGRLQREDPLSVETRGLELECLVKSGRLEEAEALAAQLQELFPRSARIVYLAGLLAYRQKNYSAAAGHFRESQRLYPHWRSSQMIAKALTQLGQLEEAESILLPLVKERSCCQLDLAWLYERKEDYGRALGAVEAFLKDYPENSFARGQRLRLRAKTMEAAEVVDEVEGLLLHDEEVPQEIMPQYVEALLKTGRGGKAREFVRGIRTNLVPRVATQIGWSCYRLQAYDLALDLFLVGFPANRRNRKFLSAIEKAAGQNGRLEMLLELYKDHAVEEKQLYGRIQNLSARLAPQRESKNKE